MLFIKGPRKGSLGKKKEEEKDRDRGRKKHSQKKIYCRVEKICRSDKKLSKNAHN